MRMLATVVAAALTAWSVGLLVPAWRHERLEALQASRAPEQDALSAARRAWSGVASRVGASGRRAAAQDRLRVVHALAALAAELQAGQPPPVALSSADDAEAVWPAAAAAARAGDDVAAGLLVDARRSPLLAQLAACWRVSTDAGTGLADVVGQLSASARSAEDVRVQLEAELAGPRATARTLAALPLAGMGFGMLMGADPIGWLLGTSPGWACLAGGLLLTALGYWWTARIAARVEAML